MNIGEFKSAANGDLLGSIVTLAIDLPRLGLKPVHSDNDRAPAFEIMALNVARRWVQVGALWEQTSNTNGETFYQGRLEDPSLTNPLPIMLFGDDVDGFRVVWNRPDRGARDMEGNRRNRRSRQDDDGDDNGGDDLAFPPLAGDTNPAPKAGRRRKATSGFGDGNATADGALIPEDHVPN